MVLDLTVKFEMNRTVRNRVMSVFVEWNFERFGLKFDELR